MLSIYLILPTALGPGVYSATNRNTCQKKKNNVPVELSSGWRVRLKSSPQTMSWLSRQCGILNISQPYRPPWPVMRIAMF
jgi:hypothetical protein